MTEFYLSAFQHSIHNIFSTGVMFENYLAFYAFRKKFNLLKVWFRILYTIKSGVGKFSLDYASVKPLPVAAMVLYVIIKGKLILSNQEYKS